MIEETPVTKHVHECVKILNQRLQTNVQNCDGALEAVFELLDLPWDQGTEKDQDFREGYETCLLDVVEAIANEWHVELPKLERP